ncbi:MAG: serine/threonine protein kinase [Xanthomonadales bacterium]|nr:serine/threonine protein kinase [Xanthomonadales bacterium]
MDAETERQVLDLLAEGQALPADARDAWLAALPVSVGVRKRLGHLLARDDQAGNFLESPASPGASSLPQLPAVGERLGPWQLTALLEAGGMGVVYRARRADGAYRQDVAVKLVQPAYLAGRDALRAALVARFAAERDILAQLQHPNIARILDAGSTADGVPYLVMEFVDGLSLTRWCETQGLDLRARVRLLCRVCEAVEAAHRHLVVHRDLKPANILVDGDGQPRLLDFGVAKLLDPARPDARPEATAVQAMTPGYASPEQLRGEAITTRADVYALGVILYELATGVLPHDLAGLSPAQAERRVGEQTAPSLAQGLARAVPAADRGNARSRFDNDLERIAGKALHREAERRYGSARELADDLRRWLDGRPVSAHPDSRGYRLSRFLRRHRLASATAALALAAVLGATALALHQARQAARAAADAEGINQFLLDILARADPGNTSEETTLAQALDEAAAQVGARFDDRPALAAGIRHAIGYSMVSRHRLEAARQQLATGHAQARAALGEDHPRTLQLLHALAWLHEYEGRSGEAEATFDQVLARLRDTGRRRSSLDAVTRNDLAVLLLNRSAYEEAREHLEQALALVERQGVEVTVHEHANMVANLAQALHGLDRLDEADHLYARAASLLAGEFPDGSRDIAILLNNRALLARDRGDQAGALDLLERSVAMRRQVYRGDHPVVVFGLVNLTRQALTVDRPGDALAHAEEAVAMAERLFARPAEEQVMALAVLAQALARGNQADEARARLDQAEAALAALPEGSERAARLLADTRTLVVCASVADGEDC